MRKIKTYCDICGQRVSKQHNIISNISKLCYKGIEEIFNYDICDYCLYHVIDTIEKIKSGKLKKDKKAVVYCNHTTDIPSYSIEIEE